MNKMLISATHADEVRVALIKESMLYDLDIEQAGLEQKKANIYKGRIIRIEPSLEAAFVDYGANRHGFLPFKEVSRSYLKPELANASFATLGIGDVFNEGQEVLVQIDKEERGNKGAALTTFISLAGSYLVLMPNNPRVGGISRRIDGRERDDLKDLLHNLNVPEGMGLIVRTAGVGKSQEELKWDLEALLRRWQEIESVLDSAPTPSLIYQEGDAVMRAVRDYLRRDIEEILVDNEELFAKTKKYIEQARPDFLDRVKLYDGDSPLFSSYQIESQIETAYQRVVKLPSGGSISIDHTEALISIDVNSAKAKGGGDIEETAFNTNLEAADEIAKQLRIRDIGGLVVIDFIDMSRVKHQQEVSRKLREALEYDRARVQVGNITRFGLLEMSRQRLGSHLGSAAQVACPRCEGRGSIRSIESLASSIVRLLEEESSKKDTAEVQIQLPVDLATYVLNEKRRAILEVSDKFGANIIVLPNPHLDTPHYKVKRFRKHEATNRGKTPSYTVVDAPEPLPSEKSEVTKKTTVEKPVVSVSAGELRRTISPAASLINKIKSWFRKLQINTVSKIKTTSNSTLAGRLSGSKPIARNRAKYGANKKYRRNSGTESRSRRISGTRQKYNSSTVKDKLPVDEGKSAVVQVSEDQETK
jgi:ribonuclease E